MGVRDLAYSLYERRLLASLDPQQVPHHVGVILDGNRRWARASGTSANSGHQAGADKIAALLEWCDDAGVTCRRWNWRQARRTALTEGTTSALFILDALDPMTDAQLEAAGDDLVEHLSRLGPEVRVERRMLRPGG